MTQADPVRRKFKVGDRVVWTSQAGGYRATKRGEVVEVVEADAKPTLKKTDLGMCRDHESYVVRASKTDRTSNVRTQLYWPKVGQLKPDSKEQVATQPTAEARIKAALDHIAKGMPLIGEVESLLRTGSMPLDATVPISQTCVGHVTDPERAEAMKTEGYRCCDRAGEYNGFGSDGPLAFTCPNHCSCHD